MVPPARGGRAGGGASFGFHLRHDGRRLRDPIRHQQGHQELRRRALFHGDRANHHRVRRHHAARHAGPADLGGDHDPRRDAVLQPGARAAAARQGAIPLPGLRAAAPRPRRRALQGLRRAASTCPTRATGFEWMAWAIVRARQTGGLNRAAAPRHSRNRILLQRASRSFSWSRRAPAAPSCPRWSTARM